MDAANQYSKALELLGKSLDIIESLRSRAEVEGDDTDRAYLDYHAAIFHINLGTVHSNNGEALAVCMLYLFEQCCYSSSYYTSLYIP